MKQFRLCVLIALSMCAALPMKAVDANYYSSLNGKKDGALREALTSLVYTHHTTAAGYNWNFADIDIVDHQVLDMYSTCEWTETSDQCGSYSNVCGCYNREHTVPQSLFNEKSPQVGDRHHLFLTDGKVNGVRSNFAFGETNETNTWKGDANGSHALGQLGKASFAYSSSTTVFEPDDQYKGDIARGVLYMVIRYATTNECRAYNSGASNEFPVTTWDGNAMFSGSLSDNYGLSDAAVQTFLKWHEEDPVSAKEIARNTGVENLQHNRNPFVDYPILVEYLWGKYKGQEFGVSNAVGSFESTFIAGVSDGDITASLPAEYAPPANYYASVEGLQDAALKSALGALSHTGTRLSYGSGAKHTWEGFYVTDRDASDNSVIDMYSNEKRYFSTTSTNVSVDGCHIEHMLPKSWWGGDENDAYKDLYHLVPADGSANSSKSNWGPGVPDMTYSSAFDNGKFQTSRDVIHDLTRCFAPADEYKGDFARAYFYVVTTYGDELTWVDAAITAGMTNDSYLEFQDWLADLLMEWHRLDPVSEKEVKRAYEVNKIQGNRNPFIDYPCLAEYIWGAHAGEAVRMSSLVSGYAGMGTDCCGGSTPLPTKYTVTWSVNGAKSTTKEEAGTRPTPPGVDNCDEQRVFVGWTTVSTYDGDGSDLMTGQEQFPEVTAEVTYYAVYADVDGVGEGAAEVQDHLTRSLIGISNATYADWSGKKASSEAVYAGNSAGGNNAIQLRSKNSTSGIITTASGGKLKSVTITWNAASDNNRVINIYGKNTPYSSAADLYSTDATVSGKLIGTVAKSGTGTINIPDSYTYIGIRSKADALYLDDIEIVWGTKGVSYSNYSTICSSKPVTYTVTWHTPEGETPVVYNENDALLMPAVPSACTENRVFMGWTAQRGYKHKSVAPGDLFKDATGVVTADADYYAVFAEKETVVEAIKTTDSITCAHFSSSSYADWADRTSYSDAIYAGNTSGGGNYIQMRANNGSGIVTTASGGKAMRIELKWKSNTVDGRTIEVYGKNTAYEKSADLYDTNKKGDKIGTIVKGTSVALDIAGDYPYVGLRSAANALYVDTIAIIWRTGTKSEDRYSNYRTDCKVFDFKAIEATDVTQTSFTANWTEADADSYELDVKKEVVSFGLKDTTFIAYEFLNSLAGWTVKKVSGYDNVWVSESGYVKATSYADGTKNPAESWLVSPRIDLSKATEATLTIYHAFRYGDVYLHISKDDGDSWTGLAPAPWAQASSWAFANSAVDLADYRGQTVRIGCQYLATDEVAGTWEIKSLQISGKANGTLVDKESLDGYPRYVIGTSAVVDELSPDTKYYYTVTPEGGVASNEIVVRTTKSTDVITSVEDFSSAPAARKLLINGQLFILRANQLYDATGRRVE